MAEVCPVCGLPKPLCVCGAIAKEEAKIKIYMEKRRFGKWVTIVDGVEEEAKPKELAKKLRTKLACGGTYKNGRIELRGNHKDKVRKIMIESGFPEEKIEVD